MTKKLDLLKSLSPAKQALYALEQLQLRVQEAEAARFEPIAVVGLACRLPGGVHDAESYWELLHNGVDAITEVPSDRWDKDLYFDPDPDSPGMLTYKWGGFLEKINQFDAAFFGISRREANAMDPQQRLLLEVAWDALETAGLAPEALRGSATGVFFGMTTNDYLQHLGRLSLARADAYMPTGNSFSVAAGRLSHVMGFEGPSLTLDTACSSSLVAVHLASQSLRTKECDVALAGGVNLILRPHTTVSLSKARILAADGRCKSFDATADGYVRGEGCGIVVLKRHSDARADGDRILALIRGSAVMHDGSSSGLTVPNGRTQEKLLRQACSNARVEPRAVTYVEAHGSGTALGDPIEMGALRAVLGAEEAAAQPLHVGSVKTNLGHLEAASGVAALIKTILALQHREIPPHLHFRNLNPHIALDGCRIRIPTEPTNWPACDGTRIAGVSSFGFSGTNAHVVLEEVAEQESRVPSAERPFHLVCLSAKTKTALGQLAGRYQRHLDHAPEQRLCDIAHTANAGRSHFGHRMAVLTSSREELRDTLDCRSEGKPTVRLFASEGDVAGKTPKVVFLFPGQGVQFADMGRGLFEGSPQFRETLEQCDAILRPLLDRSLIELLYGTQPVEERDRLLDRSRFTQPALFAIQYALAGLWRSWGIEPAMVLGQSLGEYAAACVAGVMTLEDGLTLVAARGRLTDDIGDEGAMAAVYGSERQVAKVLAKAAPSVSIAAVNSSENVVIAGAAKALDGALDALSAAGIETQRLRVSYASHSPLMDPILGQFEREADRIIYAEPHLGLISTVTGKLQRRVNGAYWARHLREPVRLADGMKCLSAAGCDAFVEIGPGASLSALGSQCLSGGLWLPSLKEECDDWEQILESLARLYAAGAEVDWSGVDRPYARRKCALPTYPFQRQRYWIDVQEDETSKPSASVPQVEPEVDEEGIGPLLFDITWRRQEVSPSSDKASAPGVWILFAQDDGMGADLAQALEAQGDTVFRVAPSDDFCRLQPGHYGVSPHDWTAIQEILDEARQAGSINGVIHLWGLASPDVAALSAHALERHQELSCGGALALVKALTLTRTMEEIPLWLVTCGAQRVGDGPSKLQPQQMPLLALGRVIATEHPELHCRRIDLDPTSPHRQSVEQLVSALSAPDVEDQIAYRQGARYVPRLIRVIPVDAVQGELAIATGEKPIRKDGSYLIAGGLGGLGLMLAQWLVEKGAASLALLARNAPGPAATAAIDRLTKAGVQVAVFACDLSGEEAVDAALAEINTTLPPIRGVIHAAGVVDDGALQQLDWSRFAAATVSKLSGAWHLHRATAALDLDWFVCCSSAAAVLGPPGQGSYAAANAFMDALMQHRRDCGLPGLGINWGPWAGIGMASRIPEVHRARLNAYGIDFMEPARALQALGWALANKRTQLTVCRFDPAALDNLPGFDVPPFLSDLANRNRTARSDATILLLLGSLAEANGAGRGAILAVYVKYLVARLLQADTQEIQTDRHLSEYGVDSIMIMTLAQQLEADLRLPVRTNEIFKRTTIGEIARYLNHKLGDDNVREEPGLGDAGSMPKKAETNDAGGAHQPAHGIDDMDLERPGTGAVHAALPHDGPLPLSFGQQGLWSFERLRPGTAVYTIRHAVRLEGPLDLVALERSLNEIVRRHEVLRTSFVSKGGEPRQVIDPFLYVPIEFVDLTTLPRAERRREAQKLATEVTGRPFDLAQVPLFRATCLRLDECEHLLLLPMHHIVSDGWSLGVLLHELSAIYEAFTRGAPSPLPPLRLQYADFADQQRRSFEGGLGERQMSYWRNTLRNAPPALELPTDWPRPPLQNYRAARLPLILSGTLSRQLDAVSRAEGVTLFVTLLAVFKLLLSRLSGQQDIVVGSPVANRNRAELHDLIGFFVNILPLRTNLSEVRRFPELLQQVSMARRDGLAHQDLPFDVLLEDMTVERDLSRNPIVQVVFNFVETEERTLSFSDLHATSLPAAEPDTKFDLTLYVRRRDEGLTFDLVWNADLFSEERVAMWLDHYHALLQAIAADPAIALADLPSQTGQNRRMCPAASAADIPAPEADGSTLVEAFERQVQIRRDQLALRSDARDLTYGELNGDANQIARFLVSQGVRKGDRIALVFDQDAPVIAAILGVLKAGAAYVPVAPQQPDRRIGWLVGDVEANIVLTDGANYQRISALVGDGNSTVVVADVEKINPGIVRDDLACKPAPGDLAYILYTSGSTGEPKGVMQSHGNAVYYARHYANSLGIAADDRISLLSSYAFDAAVMDIFGALLQGASLHPIDLLAGFAIFPTWIAANEITILHLTPTALSQLAQGLSTDQRLDKVRALVLGGEEANLHHFEIFKRHFSEQCLMVNGLGPTESTLALQYQLSQETELRGRAIPVGFPVGEVEIQLLDSDGREAPYLGEIVIRGSHLAVGYWRRPDLTAKSFRDAPEGKRLFFSGDLGRRRPDGAIEFAGRRDRQVKIRGFRVELGEVEAALRQHPAVIEARVTVAGEGANRGLMACVVPGGDVEASELLRYLRQKLPSYMLPSRYVCVAALPMKENGKLNFQALSALEAERPGLTQARTSPETDIERRMIEIWEEVLERQGVATSDDFFALGGHSLRALWLLSRISEEFGVDLSIKSLFLHPTVAELARELKGEDASAARDLPSRVPRAIGSIAAISVPFSSSTPKPQAPVNSLGGANQWRLDAAALGLLPEERIRNAGFVPAHVIDSWLECRPTLVKRIETPWGSIGIILLPRLNTEAYREPHALVDLVIQGMETAAELGARSVSLTGLLGSATDYGRAIAKAPGWCKGLPSLSTGHDITAASVNLSLQRILSESGRDLSRERVGLMGAGSIGRASLLLMMQSMPPPAELILCDLYDNAAALRSMARALWRDSGYRGKLQLLPSRGRTPSAFYTSSVIIGASNVANVLEVDRLSPGTLIVDDSAPPCLSPDRAVQRMRDRGDILVTSGGILQTKEAFRERVRLPQGLAGDDFARLYDTSDPHRIGACVLSSLLSAKFEAGRSDLGPATAASAERHLTLLASLGIEVGDLRLGPYTIGHEVLERFHQQFGSATGIARERKEHSHDVATGIDS